MTKKSKRVSEMPEVHEPSMMERAEMMSEDLLSAHMKNSSSFKKVAQQMAKRMNDMMAKMGRGMMGKKGMM